MSRRDWAQVARLVRARREQLGLTQQDAVTRADGAVSIATWRNIETAARPPYRAASLRAVSRSLGWTSDSIDRILDGSEPVLVDDIEEPPESSREEILRRLDKIEALLADMRAERRQDSARARTGD